MTTIYSPVVRSYLPSFLQHLLLHNQHRAIFLTATAHTEIESLSSIFIGIPTSSFRPSCRCLYLDFRPILRRSDVCKCHLLVPPNFLTRVETFISVMNLFSAHLLLNKVLTSFPPIFLSRLKTFISVTCFPLVFLQIDFTRLLSYFSPIFLFEVETFTSVTYLFPAYFFKFRPLQVFCLYFPPVFL